VRAFRVLAPLVWTGVIAWLSTDTFGAEATSGIVDPVLRWLLPWAAPETIETLHWIVRKTGHVAEYGTLAALWAWALARRDGHRHWLVPLALTMLTAVIDETHQTFTRTRTGTPADVLLDSAAAGAVLICVYGGGAAPLGWLTGALLWIAAAGGAALIALDWTAGIRAGWLWWSVPAAGIALVFWRRRRRS